MNQGQIIVYLVALVCSLIGIKQGGQKLKSLSLSYLLHLFIRPTIYINLWVPAIIGSIAAIVYFKNKAKEFKFFAIITLLFYLFGKTPLFDLTISFLLLLNLYNERVKKQDEKK